MCLSGSLSSTQPLLPGDLLQVEERPEVRLCVPVWERSSRPPLSWWPPSSGWRERDQLRVLAVLAVSAVSECPPALTHLPPSHCHVASWDTYHLSRYAMICLHCQPLLCLFSQLRLLYILNISHDFLPQNVNILIVWRSETNFFGLQIFSKIHGR